MTARPATSPRKPLPRRRRRIFLATLALAAIAGPVAAPGCSAGFAPISQVTGLRVLAVVADKPYAQPGDTVTFTMTYDDSFDRPPPLVVWIAGCFDPDGDEYFLCYEQLAPELKAAASGGGVPPGLLGFGPTFSLTLPSDLITRRTPPAPGNPYYGIAYVFFAACAGTLKPVPPEGTGTAGSFPLGCFDAQGNRLGADSFVPGYTQVYAFSEGWTNENPVVNGLKVDGAAIRAGACVPDKIGCADGGPPDGGPGCCEVSACSVPEETRQEPGGCGRKDPFSVCNSYAVSVDVPAHVAELDPATKTSDGTALHETVWVDYFADKGDFDSPVLLISDAQTGIQPESSYTTNYIAPPLDADAGADAGGGDVKIWAVVHDSRGGETVIQRSLRAQ